MSFTRSYTRVGDLLYFVHIDLCTFYTFMLDDIRIVERSTLPLLSHYTIEAREHRSVTSETGV